MIGLRMLSLLNKLVERRINRTVKSLFKRLSDRQKAILIEYIVNNYSDLACLNRKIDIDNEFKIAILLDGGFGDTIIGLSWVYTFIRAIYNPKIKIILDLYGKVDYLENLTSKTNCIKINKIDSYVNYESNNAYDIKLSIAHFIRIDVVNKNKISEKHPKCHEILNSFLSFQAKYNKYCINKPFFDGAWARLCILKGWNRWSELGANKSIEFSPKNKYPISLDIDKFNILAKYELCNTDYITIHTGSDITQQNEQPVLKNWPSESWNKLCSHIKEHYPKIKIVQLGGSVNSLSISNTDLNLCGKTCLKESSIILKHSLIHIDNESGLVHLRNQLSGKSVVLFGPTPVDFYGYDENINIVSPIPCNGCMWMINDWNTLCVKNESKTNQFPAECMKNIDHGIVFDSVSNYLSNIPQNKYELLSYGVYGSEKIMDYRNILVDIANMCHIDIKPISEHMYGECRTYIHASKQWEYPFCVENIEKLKTRKLKIADIGGGRGALSNYLSSKGHDVIEFDMDFCWDNGGDENIEQRYLIYAKKHGYDACHGSIFNIQANDESFDVITCISVLEHIPYKSFALKEMLRVLKCEGILILTFDLSFEEIVDTINDAMRVEVFTPSKISNVLAELGIYPHDIFTIDNLKKSVMDISSDMVLGIPSGMTVGGLVIRKMAGE
jgi:2-polyprenyl-3-methyl-5-hydroxy-6-metoxy-1,4-benzoquinol methylase